MRCGSCARSTFALLKASRMPTQIRQGQSSLPFHSQSYLLVRHVAGSSSFVVRAATCMIRKATRALVSPAPCPKLYPSTVEREVPRHEKTTCATPSSEPIPAPFLLLAVSSSFEGRTLSPEGSCCSRRAGCNTQYEHEDLQGLARSLSIPRMCCQLRYLHPNLCLLAKRLTETFPAGSGLEAAKHSQKPES